GWLDAEHVEVVPADQVQFQPFGNPPVLREERVDAISETGGGDHALEKSGLLKIVILPPGEDVHLSGRCAIRAAAPLAFAEKDQTRRIPYRQLLEDYRIDEAEYRGVRADAERQRENRDGGKTGM